MPTAPVISGRFRVSRRFVSRPQSELYLAVDETTGSEVVVKFRLGTSPWHTAAFARECALTRANLHPALPEGILEGVHERRPYLVTRYIREAVALADGVFDGTVLSPGRLIEAGVAICDPLRALHDSGVAHRDLTPMNVLVCEVPTRAYRLIDLGLARRMTDDPMDDLEHRQSAAGVIFGSPLVRSPELATRVSLGDQRSDVWSLAALLYLCGVGDPPVTFMAPMQRGELHALGYQLPQGPPAGDTLITGPLREVLERALRFDPTERFTDVGEFSSALQACRLAYPE